MFDDWSNAFTGFSDPETLLFSGSKAGASLGFDEMFSSLSKYAPLIALGSKVVQGIGAYGTQKKQADRMDSAISRAAEENAAAVRERASQAAGQSKQEQNVRARAAMIEKARLKAIAAESGLSGVTHGRLENAGDWAAGQDIAQLQVNAENQARQFQREEARVHAASNVDRSKIVAPSLFETGLGLLGAGLEYGMGQAKAKPGKSAGLQTYS